MHKQQQGMTLLEVLLALVVVAVGMFASASLHLKALQATENARREGQAALARHSQHERNRL